jgi:putative DNA primase/helicase
MENYAKLLFSTNELPKEVEHTNGYYRRWLIVPFDVVISENEQDKELAKKIIAAELGGVFNWVLEGLKRLLFQKKFTECTAVAQQMSDFKKQSDSVQLFIEDEEYTQSGQQSTPLKVLYSDYQSYCSRSGYRPCSLRTFSERLKNVGFELERRSWGNVVFIRKNDNDISTSTTHATLPFTP